VCIDDVVREFTRCSTLFRKLGYFYGVFITFIVFKRLEHTASGPLSMMSTIALDLLTDTLSREELLELRDGMSQSVVTLMKCPLFHNRKTRVPLLYACTKNVVVPGARLYATTVIPRLAEQDKDVLRRILDLCESSEVYGQVPYEHVSKLISIDQILSRLGLVVCSHYVYIPAPRVILQLLDSC